jgi:hypothetical protein
MRQRLESIHRRLLRDAMFQSSEGFMKTQEGIRLTTVEELVGSRGSQSVLGFLSRIDDEFLYLEDLSGYVKLSLKKEGQEGDTVSAFK